MVPDSAQKKRILAVRSALNGLKDESFEPWLSVLSDDARAARTVIRAKHALAQTVRTLVQLAEVLDPLLDLSRDTIPGAANVVETLVSGVGEPLAKLRGELSTDHPFDAWRPVQGIATDILAARIPEPLEKSDIGWNLMYQLKELAPNLQTLMLSSAQYQAEESEYRVAKLQSQFEELTASLRHALDGMASNISNQLASFDALRSEWSAGQAELKWATHYVESKKNQLDLLAQTQAADALTNNYGEFSRLHHKSHIWFRRGTLAFIVLTVLFGVLTSAGVFGGSPGSMNWQEIAWHFAVLAGGTSVATYFARQAAHHRSLENWASSIEVQLRTFDAYLGSVAGSDQEHLIRAEFARRVFGPQPEPGSSREVSEPSIGTAQLVELLTRLIKPDANTKN